MLANIIIMVLILGYCGFLIYKGIKNTKKASIWDAVDAVVTAEAVVAVPEHLTVHHPKAHV